MDRTRSTLLATAIAATLALAACGDTRDAPRTTSVTPPATTGVPTTDRMTADASRAGDKIAAAGDKAASKAGDAAITAKVKTRLMAEPGIDSLQIDVDTSNGHVTLSGEADTPQNKTRAKEIAGAIEGVTGVTDRLVVKKS